MVHRIFVVIMKQNFITRDMRRVQMSELLWNGRWQSGHWYERLVRRKQSDAADGIVSAVVKPLEFRTPS